MKIVPNFKKGFLGLQKRQKQLVTPTKICFQSFSAEAIFNEEMYQNNFGYVLSVLTRD